MRLSEEEDLVPISALQHVVFCERQAALIHVERLWEENTLTALGRLVHERVDQPGRDHRRGVRVARSVPLVSRRVGLVGIADTVEYHQQGLQEQPYPVEYKRGKRGERLADRVQLCAQAICLEEAAGCAVPAGALFYDASHRRVEVLFSDDLRQITEQAATRMRELLAASEVPQAVRMAKCRSCSLEPLCMPKEPGAVGGAGAYLAGLMHPTRGRD